LAKIPEFISWAPATFADVPFWFWAESLPDVICCGLDFCCSLEPIECSMGFGFQESGGEFFGVSELALEIWSPEIANTAPVSHRIPERCQAPFSGSG
jgi:hypothetical protein